MKWNGLEIGLYWSCLITSCWRLYGYISMLDAGSGTPERCKLPFAIMSGKQCSLCCFPIIFCYLGTRIYVSVSANSGGWCSLSRDEKKKQSSVGSLFSSILDTRLPTPCAQLVGEHPTDHGPLQYVFGALQQCADAPIAASQDHLE